MKKAEQIYDEAIEEGERQHLKFPESFALGVLIAKYDMLLRDSLQLKKELETLKK